LFEPIESIAQIIEATSVTSLSWRILSRRAVLGWGWRWVVWLFSRGNQGWVHGELVTVLTSQLAGSGVLQMNSDVAHEAVVLVSLVVDSADFLLSELRALVVELQVGIGRRIHVGAGSVGVLRTSRVAGAKALVIIGLAVSSADREVHLGALTAFLLDLGGLLVGGVGSSSESCKNSLFAVHLAKVIVVNLVFGKDWKVHIRAVFTTVDDVRAFAITSDGASHAFQSALIVIGSAVSGANRFVGLGTGTLSRTGLHCQGDLLAAEENTVAFISNSTHRANWLEIEGAFTNWGNDRAFGGINLSWGSARSSESHLNFTNVHSAFVSVSDSIRSTNRFEFSGAVVFQLAVGVHDLSAASFVEFVNAGSFQGTKTWVSNIVISAHFVVSPDAIGAAHETWLRGNWGVVPTSHNNCDGSDHEELYHAKALLFSHGFKF